MTVAVLYIFMGIDVINIKNITSYVLNITNSFT